MTIDGGIFLIQQVYNRRVENSWTSNLQSVISISSSTSFVNEGSSVVISIKTQNLENQTLYWTIEGTSGTLNIDDFNSISGSFVVQANNFGFFTIITKQDDTHAEGTEQFVVQIRSVSTSGQILKTSNIITIDDTSFKLLGNYGWYTGGFATAIVSTVDRIYFNSDTVTASVRGPLTLSRYGLGVLSDSNYAWVTGGQSGPGPITSNVERITFNSDLSSTSARGPLSSITSDHAAVNVYSLTSPSSGYLGGGGPGPYSKVNRITYATDTAAASVRGPLSLARFGLAAVSSTTIAWFGGGSGTPSFLSRVDRITYATDTATASARGPLTVTARRLASSSDSIYGWFAGGEIPGLTSRVSRIVFSSDTVAATSRGPLTSAKRGLAGLTQTTVYGFYGGGDTGSKITTVDRIDFAGDTNTATTRGPLSSARYLFDGNTGSITA